MSKVARMTVIILTGLAVLGVPAVLRVVGDQQATKEAERIRAASTAARIDTWKLLAPMFSAQAPNPIAASLGLDSSEVSLRPGGAGEWCADVRIRRLLAEDHVFLMMSADGTLRPVSRCAGED